MLLRITCNGLSRNAQSRDVSVKPGPTESTNPAVQLQETIMFRLIPVAALLGLVAVELGALAVVTAAPAEAAVCAKGVYRAGCAGPRGAVVRTRPPAYRGRTVIVR